MCVFETNITLAADKYETNLKQRILAKKKLEALPVDDGRAGLVVLLLGNPHLLEGGQGGQDGASDPDRVLSLWWGNCLDLHGGWGEGGDLLLHPVGDAGVHGGPSGQVNVGVEVLPDVHVV